MGQPDRLGLPGSARHVRHFMAAQKPGFPRQAMGRRQRFVVRPVYLGWPEPVLGRALYYHLPKCAGPGLAARAFGQHVHVWHLPALRRRHAKAHPTQIQPRPLDRRWADGGHAQHQLLRRTADLSRIRPAGHALDSAGSDCALPGYCLVPQYAQKGQVPRALPGFCRIQTQVEVVSSVFVLGLWSIVKTVHN